MSLIGSGTFFFWEIRKHTELNDLFVLRHVSKDAAKTISVGYLKKLVLRRKKNDKIWMEYLIENGYLEIIKWTVSAGYYLKTKKHFAELLSTFPLKYPSEKLFKSRLSCIHPEFLIDAVCSAQTEWVIFVLKNNINSSRFDLVPKSINAALKRNSISSFRQIYDFLITHYPKQKINQLIHWKEVTMVALHCQDFEMYKFCKKFYSGKIDEAAATASGKLDILMDCEFSDEILPLIVMACQLKTIDILGFYVDKFNTEVEMNLLILLQFCNSTTLNFICIYYSNIINRYFDPVLYYMILLQDSNLIAKRIPKGYKCHKMAAVAAVAIGNTEIIEKLEPDIRLHCGSILKKSDLEFYNEKYDLGLVLKRLLEFGFVLDSSVIYVVLQYRQFHLLSWLENLENFTFPSSIPWEHCKMLNSFEFAILIKNSCKFEAELWEFLKERDYETLEYLISVGFLPPASIWIDFIQIRDVELMRRFSTFGIPFDENASNAAVNSGDISIVKFFLEQKCPFSESICISVVKSRKWEILHLIYEFIPHLFHSPLFIEEIAWTGNHETFIWALKNLPASPKVCEIATIRGDLIMLKLAIQNKFPFHKEELEKAAKTRFQPHISEFLSSLH
jgi:hypothetical protein